MPDSCALSPTPAAALASSTGPRPPQGTLALAVVLDAETMVAIGSMPDAPPANAALFVGDGDTPRGCWRASSWPAAADDAAGAAAKPARHHFLAVLTAPNIVRQQGLAFVVQPEQGAAVTLPSIERIELEAAPLLEPLRQSGADLARAFDFLKEAVSPRQAAEPRVRAFLLAFLASISQHDGFIEIVGRPECGGLLLQGWSIHLQPAEVTFELLTLDLEPHQAVAASFERADLLATARGLIAYMRSARSIDPQALRRVYYESRGTYFHLDVVDARITLAEANVVPHLKDMLPRLTGPVGCLRGLKRVCRPRFPGTETVSTLPIPVRLARDVLLHAPGAGLFVSGWLLDPCRHVRLALLKSTHNFYARLDPNWVRLPRPDVSEGFAADPLFAQHLRAWDTLHGFMAFVPRPQPITEGEQFYIELVFEDESCGFLPVKFSEGDPQGMLRGILGAVNLGDPALDRIIAQHLGPLAIGLSPREAPPAAVSTAPFGRAPETPSISAVIPLAAGWADFDTNLARLAADPDFRDIELIIVAARKDGEPIAQALRRYAPFYGLGGSLVLADTPLDYHAALQAGSRAARAPWLLFLSPSVFPREKGWVSRLLAEIARVPGAAAISPTLFYEDDSLRYAGTGELADLCAPAPAARYRGYGRDWLSASQTQAVCAATAECCLVDRLAFQRLGGFSQEFMSADLKTLDLGLRLSAAESTSCWAPGVSLYALDDEAAEPDEYWVRIRRLVDRWAFERKWAAKIAAAATK